MLNRHIICYGFLFQTLGIGNDMNIKYIYNSFISWFDATCLGYIFAHTVFILSLYIMFDLLLIDIRRESSTAYVILLFSMMSILMIVTILPILYLCVLIKIYDKK